jgi:hypothetical protein
MPRQGSSAWISIIIDNINTGLGHIGAYYIIRLEMSQGKYLDREITWQESMGQVNAEIAATENPEVTEK